MKICGRVGLLVVALTASGLSLADCPKTMPLQLLEDCIVNENAGHSFPPSDYGHMDLYREWLKTRQSSATDLSKNANQAQRSIN